MANDSGWGLQIIAPENEKWHGVWFNISIYVFYFRHPSDSLEQDTDYVNYNLNIILMINDSISFDNSLDEIKEKK